MTGKGKKLLLVSVGALVAVFVVLYVYAEYRGKRGALSAKPPVSRGTQFASIEHRALPEGNEERKNDLRMPTERLSSTLLGKARDLYEANRLRDAIVLLEMSLFLDEDNPYTRAWLGEVREQLDNLVREYVALGNGDFQNRRYERAIYNWERVLYLLKDHTSETYEQTLKKIGYARDELKK